MDIFITDTGATETLNLVEVGETKNIAKKFIKKHACKIFGKDKIKASDAMDRFNKDGMTQASFDEWAAILKSKQAALLVEHVFLLNQDNELHPLIEGEIADSYEHQINHCGFDKKFALKNAMDAELNIFNRLAYGVISVKNPVNNKTHPDGANTSETLNIKHFRHKSNKVGDEWLMQIYCDFIMTMPDPKDSFDFTAGVELEFHKVHGGDIEHIDDEEWIFPFSMSFDQEQQVLEALHGAAQRNFIKLGIDGGVPLARLNSGL